MVGMVALYRILLNISTEYFLNMIAPIYGKKDCHK